MKVAQRMSNGETHYNETIKWLENYYSGKEEFKTYRGLELSEEFVLDVEEARKGGMEFFVDPKLPVDLVMVQSIQERDHQTRRLKKISFYTLFWIVSSVGRSLERKLQFYQIYLSRISEPRAVRIIMIMPNINEKRLENRLKKIAQDNGFGLWRITSQSELEELCPPRSFFEHMEYSFTNPPEDMQELPRYIRNKAPDITLFFDRFVIEAVDAVAGVTLEDIGKRHIERKVLDLIFDLRNVSYAPELKRLVTEHLLNKGDDYKFVSDTFFALWNQCVPGLNYSRFLEIAERPLLHIFAAQKKPYRDHYLHQFQVFILGLAIIDKLMDESNPDIQGHPNIDKQWLIASSFHDMAYPIQLYDFWAKEFFRDALGIPDIGVSDIRSHFVDKSLLSSLGFIITTMCEKHFNVTPGVNWLHDEKELVRFLHDRITKLKHHCLLSSLFLLKEAQLCSSELLRDIIVPASLAIALHHCKEVWRKYSKEKDEVWQKLSNKRKLRVLEFSKDPLTFLLTFCDCVQEWGRPRIMYPKQGNLETEEKNFVLSECTPSASGCSIRIVAPQLLRTQKKFRDKDKEFEKLEKFLKSPENLEFKIILQDRSGITREHVITS